MAVGGFISRALATLAMTLTMVAVASALPQADTGLRKCGLAGVLLRDPPTFSSNTPPGWTPPPVGWIYQPWHQVLTTNTQVASLRNFQWDPTPLSASSPADPLNDLSSFQIPGSSKVYTGYGVSTPNASYEAVLEYRGTGLLENATSEYSWLGWGCDGNGRNYYVSYATGSPASGTPAGIDVLSVVDTGVDAGTEERIRERLRESESEEIRKMAEMFVRNVQDGGRREMGRVRECDDECKTNKDLVGIIG